MSKIQGMLTLDELTAMVEQGEIETAADEKAHQPVSITPRFMLRRQLERMVGRLTMELEVAIMASNILTSRLSRNGR
jgi:hypothetical protein